MSSDANVAVPIAGSHANYLVLLSSFPDTLTIRKFKADHSLVTPLPKLWLLVGRQRIDSVASLGV